MNTWKSTGSGTVAASITRSDSKSPSSDHADDRRKRTAREAHKSSAETQKMVGHKAKMHHAKRHSEKVQMKKQLKAHDERNVKQKDDGAVKEGALPAYLLDREGQKVCLLSVCPERCSCDELNNRTPKPYPPPSRTEERTARPSIPFRCPRCGVSPRRRCSKRSRQASTRTSRGSAWSTRRRLLARGSRVNLSSWR